MFIPRYRPAVSLTSAISALTASEESVHEASNGLRNILGIPNEASMFLVRSARHGLYTFFRDLASRDQRRTVLVSAQICPLVPSLLQGCGFSVRFVDVDPIFPSPGPNEFRNALSDPQIGDDAVAIIISPFYGYIPDGWETFIKENRDRAIVLDLAQGLSLNDRLGETIEHCDTAVFSLRLGKGADCNGAILACRQPLSNRLAAAGLIRTVAVIGPSILQAAALRLAIATDLYQPLIGMLDRSVETTKTFDPQEVLTNYRLPDAVAVLFLFQIREFITSVSLARERSAKLLSSAAISQATHFEDAYASEECSHLRQVLRLRDASRRNSAVEILRGQGIDLLAAGEPLPNSYFPDLTVPDDFWPNAHDFVSDSIRLPFLGRMPENEFKRILTILERYFAHP